MAATGRARGGAGKIALLPDMVVGREGKDLLLRNYAGEISRYPDVEDESVAQEKEGAPDLRIVAEPLRARRTGRSRKR